ncbi:hypothetical protein FRC02_011638 [Tulasnella sp. 418]|nr:hypothetical protein FRC02_011638 [Tulasnella sp. 418]
MFALSSDERQRRITIFNQRRSSEASELTDILMRQWPCRAPVITERRDWVFDISRLEKESAPAFQTWFQNKELREYVQDIQRTLDEVYRSAPMQLSTYAFASNNDQTASVSNQHLLPQLFTVRDAPCVPSPATSLKDSLQGHQGFSIDSLVSSRAASGKCNTPSLDDLQALLIELRSNTFLQSGDPAAIQLQYADDLERSFQSLKKEIGAADNRYESSKSQMLDVVRGWYISCGERLQAAREIIQASLSPRSLAEKTIFSAGLWPSLTPRSILGVLGLVAYDRLPGPWRRALNSYARTLLTYQHACRLLNYLRKNSFEEFTKELESTVIEAEVDEEEYSIRLLIQIDGDFLARSIQIDFTKEMASPSSRNNTVLQLNMGEGKTSVIAPLVAASLSDGKALVRVVVLKPLAPSMFQLLVHRLGGLANRRVFYMPFSRTPQLKIEQVEQVQNLFTECVNKRGILLVQPEHILSFKLMGLDRKFNPRVLDSSESLVANRLLDSQRWLDKNSRDILDESDEILHVKYQLVYTIGQQQPLDGSPDRWSIAQQILTLVRKHAEEVHRLHPGRIEVQDDNSGRYPRVRILQDEAGVELVRLIAEDVAGGALDQCSFNLFQPNLRSLALDYITTLDLTSQDIRPLEDHCKSSAIWSIILILRGLLAHGILQFVLKEKRWRVDYGLDPSRTMLAVPYRAKDVPSLRAEFNRLIQGCMRMRKLGHGHSVMFFAPPEVDHSIRTVCSLGSDGDIHTKHILLWAMLESCTEVVHRISQWAQQGIDHSNRERAKIQFNASPDAYAGILQSTWMQKEARTLDEMFASPQLSTMAGQSHSLKEHPTILERYLKWAPSTSIDARVQEEQEREVILEVETERQVERPPKAIPATHRVHEDLRTLVHTGVFNSDSSAFTPLFKPLTGSHFEDNGWASQHLYCTHDFSITIQSVHSTSSDYLRPIHWVISAAQTTGTIYIVLSPHEVNELLPDIRRSNKVHLHHYSPRVTKAMKSFEDLALHCIPPLPLSWTGPDLGVITRLNLWAGQLYLQDQRVYRYLCNFLGLYSWQPSEEDLIQPDGFIKPEHRRASLISDCAFERSPVHYLKQLLSSRRKGMDFFSTHMGKVLRGRLLIDEDFHSA